MRAERAREAAGLDREDMCRWAPAAEAFVVALVEIAPTFIVRWVLRNWVLDPLKEWRLLKCAGKDQLPGGFQPLNELLGGKLPNNEELLLELRLDLDFANAKIKDLTSQLEAAKAELAELDES